MCPGVADRRCRLRLGATIAWLPGCNMRSGICLKTPQLCHIGDYHGQLHGLTVLIGPLADFIV